MEEAPRPDPDPDALLRRWRERGDAAALGALFDATAPELFSIALHLCRDPAMAEDALQETYLAALASLDRFDGDRRVVPWLAGILRNKVHEVRRFEARTPDPRRVVLPADPGDPLAAAATAEEEARVRAALDELEEPYREVAILRWRHGLDPAEIAAVKRMAPGTVRSLLHRAAERLRRDLSALPAFLLLGEGTHAPRGLAAVRAEVVRRAPHPVGTGAVPVAGTIALLGGVLMAKKALLLVGTLLLLGGIGWFALGDADPAPAPVAPASSGPAAAATAAPTGRPPSQAPTGPAAPEAPLPVAGPRITGRVVDREGRPIPGARVGCYPDTLAKTLLPSELGTDGHPGAVAVAAADGRFEVAAAPDAPFHVVLASAPGFADGILPQVRAGGEADLVLVRPFSLTGRVLDLEGAPVPRAEVRVLHLVDALRIERSGAADAEGVYRVTGLAPPKVHSGMTLPSQLLVEVRAEGFAPLLLEGGMQGSMEPGGTATLDAILSRGSGVAGRVLDAGTGEPLPGARVVLWSIEGMMSFGRSGGSTVSSPWGPRPLQETLSAADGTYRFDGVPCEGAHPTSSHNMGQDGRQTVGHVGAWKDGWCGMSLEVPLVAEGKVTERELRLAPAATVRGRVVDGEGRPVTETRVWATREGGPRVGWFPPFYREVPLSWAVTDAAGTYRIRGLPAERDAPVTFTVTSRRRNAGERVASEEGKVECAAVAGAEVEAPDIVLPGGEVATAVIHVADEAGAPVWGATVAQAQEFGGGATRTDATGRAVYSVPLHSVDGKGGKTPRVLQPVNLTAKAPGFGPAAATVTPAATDPPEVRLVLHAGLRLSGRVVGADGLPVKGASVSVANGAVALEDVFPEGGPQSRPRTGPGAPAILFYGYASTGEDGRFTVADLPPGPWHVQAYRYLKVYGRSQGAFAGPKTLRVVAAGVGPESGDLLLTLPADESPPTGILEGTVLDAATGKPVWSFNAWLSRGQETVPGGRPSGGKFRIEGVPEGAWTLQVTAAGFAAFSLPDLAVPAGETPGRVEVKLSRGVTVVGRFRDAAGGSLADLNALFTSDPGENGQSTFASAVIDPEGAFRVAGLTPGNWTATVSGGGWGANQKTFLPVEGARVVIEAGTEEVRLDAVVAAAGVLSVGVRDPRFPPNGFEGGKATAEQAAFGAASRMEIRDGAGRVIRMAGGVAQGFVGPLGYVPLLPGDYVVRLETPGNEPREERVRVEAGKRASVAFKGE